MLPRIIVFDLDNTLAASKQPVSDDLADLLTRLLAQTSIAVTSGGKLDQLQHQIIERMTRVDDFSHFYLLPTSGAALYAFTDEAWKQVYQEELSSEEVVHIEEVLEHVLAEIHVIDLSVPSFGERIEFRGAQVTLSALGQAWDPDGSKRSELQDAISKLLPEYDVKRGGSTSIDITKKGVNKAYGVRKLSEYASVPISDMLYVGDALYPNGNDEVVKETGIPTHEVRDQDETAAFIGSLLVQIEE
jgi:HAD superfamily hydrolase (TIGR01484 family)